VQINISRKQKKKAEKTDAQSHMNKR
jgi:hypothetical protein